MSLIEVKNVSFGYTKDMILEEVNMTVEEQEYVGIIGANGAGKSTLMKLILGELTPVKGEIIIHEKTLGYVPQVGFSRISNFPANVEEIVMMNLYSKIGAFHFPSKEHRKRVDEVLNIVGMQDYKKRMFSDLSGGQQQRVMIARALVSEPKLLLLDEPFTGIDQTAEAMLYELLHKLHTEQGLAILMISHNTEQIARYTNRVYHVKHRTVHEDHSAVVCDDEWKNRKIIQTTSHYYTTKKEMEASKNREVKQ